MSNRLGQMLLIVRLRFEYYFYSFVKPETLESLITMKSEFLWHINTMDNSVHYGRICHIWYKKVDFNQGHFPEWLENSNVS